MRVARSAIKNEGRVSSAQVIFQQVLPQSEANSAFLRQLSLHLIANAKDISRMPTLFSTALEYDLNSDDLESLSSAMREHASGLPLVQMAVDEMVADPHVHWTTLVNLLDMARLNPRTVSHLQPLLEAVLTAPNIHEFALQRLLWCVVVNVDKVSDLQLVVEGIISRAHANSSVFHALITLIQNHEDLLPNAQELLSHIEQRRTGFDI